MQLLLELTHAGLAGVALDHLAQGRIREIDALARNIVARQQLRPQVMLGDGHLLFGDVARETDLLHAVEQWPRDRIEGVGGTHEQHLGEIQAHVEIMIEEVDVLLGIEHLEQSRGRVALERLAQLVDLVEHDHRVLDLDLLERLHQLAGHGTDVGAPMALDLGLVAHAAHREAIELPAQRLGDGAAHGGLAHPGRADQQQDGATHVALEGALGEELDDPLLDVLEAVVVAVEYRAGMGQVELILAAHAPRHRGEPVEVVARGAVLRRAGLQHRELVELLFDAGQHLGRHDEALETVAEGVDVVLAVVLGDAQLALDHLELLAQKELALTLLHLGVDLLADLGLQLGDVDLLAQQRQHLLHARLHRQRLQHGL